MQLNDLQPGQGAKHSGKRLGRGTGSGLGKTCGKGHKGQKARSGGYNKVGFEGGQMPLQRRLPKFGFTSRKAKYVAKIRLHELNKVESDIITFDVLKAAGLVNKNMKFAKVFLAGEITKAVTLHAIKVTKGARQAIEKAGGKVSE